ncbi:MAG: P-loop NTPase [Nitrospirota bacterium]
MHGDRTASILAIGGGKGGVGKSIFAIAIATSLARRGHRVILADLDLGAANLHTYLGILKRTPTIANFILQKVSSLEDLVIETPEPNLGLISGAEFVPGVTNPPPWMKRKLIRQLRQLPSDFIVLDLGAGVQFNTLDFFGIANHGIVITAPEPGAVMNAYSFLKGSLFRKMQAVFRNHPDISRLIGEETKQATSEKRFTLDWFRKTIGTVAPDLLELVREIEQSFQPALVINRAPEGRTHILVDNLISLCTGKLGISLNYAGDLPEARELTNHLLNVPRFFSRPEGTAYFQATDRIGERLVGTGCAPQAETGMYGFSDEEQDEILQLIEALDQRVFTTATRTMWKLRLFFKPADVISFLVSRGITHPLFYKLSPLS